MMLKIKRIVGWGTFAALALLSLASCGQKGALILPTESAAQNRATLPQVLNPASPASPASPPASSATPAASAPKR